MCHTIVLDRRRYLCLEVCLSLDLGVLLRFVDCLECGRKMHKICVLHVEQIWPLGFMCEPCRARTSQKRKDNKYTAKRKYSNFQSSGYFKKEFFTSTSLQQVISNSQMLFLNQFLR